MSKYYKQINHKQKIGIGRAINSSVRDHVFENGWQDDIATVITSVGAKIQEKHRFISCLFAEAGEESEEEKRKLKKVMAERIIKATDSFAEQQATPKQIYFYIYLCGEVNEEHKELHTNKEVHIEIDRLLKLKNKGVS